MTPWSVTGFARHAAAIVAAVLLGACVATGDIPSGNAIPVLFPADGARNVSPDTHLKLTFAAPPQIGASGMIRIYDAADNTLVDTLDMSIPASPRPTGRATESNEAERQALGRNSQMSDFQVDTIGGTDFHFFPIIVRDTTATIYPHQGKLKYGRTYVVKMDASVIVPPDGAPAGAVTEWTFSTRAAPPSANATLFVVAEDGSGDFNTVQGAIDFVPDQPASPITIEIRNGHYEELVFLNNKSNLIIRGEDRDKTVVGYPNNSSFNPPRGGPSRRPAFSIYNSNDIQLSTFTINNYFFGQAEALLARGQRNIVHNMTLNGSGDALTTAGTLYMADSKLVGDGDTILGYAALYCLRCELYSAGPFTWTRTPEGSHGNVFVDSTFIYLDKPLPWTITEDEPGRKAQGVLARLPKNGPAGAPGANFPFAEMVLINAKMDGVPPEGWGPVEDPPGFDSSRVRFWEFNTTDLQGNPIDMSKRHPIVRILDAEKDAGLIASYSDPAFVLNGWQPKVASAP